MAVPSRVDPLPAYHFMIELKGAGIVGAFRECSALTSESQIIEYKAADEKGETRVFKIPGPIKVSDITLKRGITTDKKLWEWRKKIEDGKVKDARADGSVVIFSQANGEE